MKYLAFLTVLALAGCITIPTEVVIKLCVVNGGFVGSAADSIPCAPVDSIHTALRAVAPAQHLLSQELLHTSNTPQFSWPLTRHETCALMGNHCYAMFYLLKER